ncbi:hypothetical protein LRP30_04605 [Bradyrhizobium sp. C-145]|uniref:hypothetical protein n=1 Tax=Bradyrhizobium sp. C-145 TaxID=574727 RepID=UPI00201B5C25|nr:hypothetical protein [Bradyrhizobium sp. C-145]UQR64589.1 hypothetical protein LRP30_04605 [Bradyrhizobium sp. C-145]
MRAKNCGNPQSNGVFLMCDYSLHAVRSRPARAGDMLITSEFPDTATRGFSAVGEPGTAVCLLPGTELAFSEDAACNHPFAKLFPGMRFGSVGARLARFRKINRQVTDTHHDALEFANGKVVPLTKLRVGQKAVVLQLPAKDGAGRKALEVEQDPAL